VVPVLLTSFESLEVVNSVQILGEWTSDGLLFYLESGVVTRGQMECGAEIAPLSGFTSTLAFTRRQQKPQSAFRMKSMVLWLV